MKLNSSYYTEKGSRANNEDAVFVRENDVEILAIAADGLGGHADGEVASNLAVSTISQFLNTRQPNEDLLIDAIRQASTEICNIQDPLHPMHTTVAAIWLDHSVCFAANVGDSRIYQFRNGTIVYQSLDHSVAQMAVLVGEIKQDEIRSNHNRNRLIRVLGDSNVPTVDSKTLSVQAGDRFLLCSDGFWEVVTETDMLRTITTSNDAESWLRQMREIIAIASNPSQDNHSAIAIMIEEIP